MIMMIKIKKIQTRKKDNIEDIKNTSIKKRKNHKILLYKMLNI